MNNLTPKILLALALVFAVFSFVGDDSYSRLKELEYQLAKQRKQNTELNQYVTRLKDEIFQLQTSDRALEHAARNELGMARADELIFVFDEQTQHVQEVIRPEDHQVIKEAEITTDDQ